ncbi:NADH-quinone oxidoreductase subunit J family protein [Limnochorda pilosa]|uniref:NADH-quinone oxidoreductase subunit J n=1 Tax=Limnochorda pilosa TaxID=1555112 RepID=A0A0K2SP74_LIMPI|nr:NADH-quinone oxidoreductase subunit J [Limnochorda pilosa]BAS28938.1 NADH dehydrogenase subunit J [Limnochorda pilosa]
MTILFFAVGTLMALAGAVGVVMARKPVHGVIAMILDFAGLAVLYLTLQAEFLAVVQLIVYAGAVMVLFLFVVALLTAEAKPPELRPARLRGQRWLGGTAAGLLLAVLAGVGLAAAGRVTGWTGDFGQVARFGQELLTTHLLAFELLSMVLMIAVVGVVILVGRRRPARGPAGHEPEAGGRP